MARVKQIIGWTAIVLLAATLAGIWVLTEQNAVQTSLLSESTARVVEGQAAGVQAADATGEAQTENGMTGGTDSAASNVRSGRLAFIRMWVGMNVRRVAHTVEFFFVGLFASVVVVCFSRRPWSVCSRCVPVLLFCAACFVGDQVHKIFVPGRHFDVVDLGFDAAGYVTAMLFVLLAAARTLDYAILERCAAHLKRARAVNLFGIGASRLVAHDLAQKLMRVDKECHLYDDWHDQLLCAKNMHEGDMAIAFSYSGLTQEVLDCTVEAQRHNCPVVAVTKVDGSSKLATMADAVLGVAASEPLVRSGAMASRMAQLMVVDALYAAYVASDYERATHVIKQNYIEKQER